MKNQTIIPFNILKEKFSDIKLKPGPHRLKPGEVIIDPEKFVESHIHIINSNPGNKTILPFYDRLLTFYNQIKNQK